MVQLQENPATSEPAPLPNGNAVLANGDAATGDEDVTPQAPPKPPTQVTFEIAGHALTAWGNVRAPEASLDRVR